ncbi:MAG: hypothetical protein P1U68_08040 [Verrucomicrobiales bacterium]|nr:hypothetical protein [Verrucomicrobiales bacterium]
MGLAPGLAVLLNGALAYIFASGKMFAHAEFRGFWYSLGAISLVGMTVLIFRFKEDGASEAR